MAAGSGWYLRPVWVVVRLGSQSQQLSFSRWYGFYVRTSCSKRACRIIRGLPTRRAQSSRPRDSYRIYLSLTLTYTHCTCPHTPLSLLHSLTLSHCHHHQLILSPLYCILILLFYSVGDFFNCLLYNLKIPIKLIFHLKVCPYFLAFLFKYFVLIISEISSFIFLKIVFLEFLFLFIFSGFFQISFLLLLFISPFMLKLFFTGWWFIGTQSYLRVRP